MPDDVTPQEFIVTAYVNENLGAERSHYTTYDGMTVWTYASEPNQRWIDTDSDGWIDYGRREGAPGQWQTFDGFVWRDSRGNIVPHQNDEPPIGGSSRVSFGEQDSLTDIDTAQTPGSDDGWFL